MKTPPAIPAQDTPVVITVMGPTASGKSALAMSLAQSLADSGRDNPAAEIISVDSAQVYRGLDVGTAKPSTEDRRMVPHHLIDICDPTESYSAARFRHDALRLVGEIVARNRQPILVGGTMLYFKALREGLSTLPQADPQLRSELDADAVRHGWPALHAELAKVDPVTAARLAPNDAQRIQRALEIYRLTGRPMSEHIANQQAVAPPFRMIGIGLIPSDRSVLHRRIESRFKAMLAAGLTDELQALRQRHTLHPGLPSMRTVGYRQAWAYLDRSLDKAALLQQG